MVKVFYSLTFLFDCYPRAKLQLFVKTEQEWDKKLSRKLHFVIRLPLMTKFSAKNFDAWGKILIFVV